MIEKIKKELVFIWFIISSSFIITGFLCLGMMPLIWLTNWIWDWGFVVYMIFGGVVTVMTWKHMSELEE